MPSLSVILITKNEASNIANCLNSVSFADEIIVLDSGSEDDTVTLAKQHTPHVFSTDWPGFGRQKNRALDKATGDWVLAIDADEQVTPELATEIQAVIQQPEHQAYSLPRHNSYCGYLIKYGDVGNDRIVRLFKRGSAHFSDDVVHETIIVNDTIGKLKKPLLHDSYTSLEDLLTRLNHYTTLSAEQRFKRGKKSSLTKAVAHSAWAFFKAYFLRRGFLDGRIGFIVAVSSAESSYYRYAKLWLLQTKVK